jgi:hypothetical protein
MEVRRPFPVPTNLLERESLKKSAERGAWPRLAKACLPNTVALLALFEKLAEFWPQATECY